MNKLILNENFFKYLAEEYSTAWNVLKGRFWVMIRSWINVYRIWQADSQQEFEEAVNEGNLAIDNIKRDYRPYEEKYAQNNGVFNSTYGDDLLFLHPGMALASMLIKPFSNQRYRQDVSQLMQDEKVGLTHLPGIGPFLQDARTETPGGRRVQYGPDGEITGYEDVVTIEDREGYRAPILSVIDTIKGIFENKEVQPDRPKASEKELATQAAKDLVSWMDREGVLDSIKGKGDEILKERKKQFDELVAPAANTIKKMADLSSAKGVEQFQDSMRALASSNKLLKDLDPGKFSLEIENSIKSVRNDSELMEKLKEGSESEEISDDQLRDIIFIQVRNVFTKNVIQYLEEFYESYREWIMKGTTEAGLKAMQKTNAGKEYSKLIKSNIQLLDDALQSLKNIAIQGEH